MKIKIADHEKIIEIDIKEEETLLDAMKRHGIYMPAYCAGRGTCKKCRIQLLEGTLAVTEADKAAFDAGQLAAGMRLSCQARPESDCTVRLCTLDEDDFEILTEGQSFGGAGSDRRAAAFGNHSAAAGTYAEYAGAAGGAGYEAAQDKASARGGADYGIAVDIGTTTIAMELLDLATGAVCARDSRINHQRAFGADVISRIQASVDGSGAALRMSICRDLLEGIGALMEQAGITGDQLRRMFIAANTTMCHLLMGYPCHSLGVAPFTPVNISTIRTDALTVLGEALGADASGADVKTRPEAPGSAAAAVPGGPAGRGSVLSREAAGKLELVVLPGISTFVGADIVAGLLVCDFAQQEAPCMLIDLGTNGEMAIGNRLRRIATSTAAGPAFEGGNISCGTGSVKGAIHSVTIDGEEISYQTIGGAAPVGICGTGVLDITAELVAHEIVDETGLLDDDYFDEGILIARTADGEPITFTQKDVREIQLAKAAVRAGIEVLLKRYGAGIDEIAAVYLSGGFGFRLDVDKAIAVGLLPESFRGKIKISGNSSLAGARACLLDDNCLETARLLAESTEELSLANDVDFNNFYMDAMCFESEY